MGKIRLDKYLADMGIGTRSQVKQQIRKGGISVNGVCVKSPEYKIDTEKDQVEVQGKSLCYEAFEYYMLNKPKGVVSATEDKWGENSVGFACFQKEKGFVSGGTSGQGYRGTAFDYQ